MLLDRHGRTFAEEAGVRLADRPAPLYQLLVLATLLSARISVGVAVGAAREPFRAGCRTPRAMAEASWQDRMDALGRGHYRRYDERTATMLGDGAQLCLDRWRGDLRRLRKETDGKVRNLHSLLTEFPGIGPIGADIFLRRSRASGPTSGRSRTGRWRRVRRRSTCPRQPMTSPGSFPRPELARLASALVRVALDRNAAEELRTAWGR